jgi:hypothetical protein
MIFPTRSIAAAAAAISLLMGGAMNGARAYVCQPAPPAAPQCGNPEFQSCRIDVPVGGGAAPVPRHSAFTFPRLRPARSFP